MNTIEGVLVAPQKKLAIVVSCFNKKITEQLLQNALKRCAELGINDDQLDVVRVPGAVEIPVAVSWLAKQKERAAIVCLGAIIKGETAHFEYVSQLCIDGCRQVMLADKVPVIMGVLTTYTYQQALARTNGEVINTGVEAIETACKMASVNQKINALD